MNSNLLFSKQALKPFALFLLFSLFSLNSFSQGTVPSCTDIISTTPQLIVGGDCASGTTDPFTGANNTEYWQGTSCNAQTNPGNPDTTFDDAWGWFVGTGDDLTITYTADASDDPIIHIFAGGTIGNPGSTCDPNMVEIACSNASTGLTETITPFPTTLGAVYLVRIQEFDSGTTMAGEICIFGGTPPPANDECADAITIDCTTNLPTETTNLATTVSSAATGCILGDKGVWYTFVGDGQQWTLTATPTGGFDLEMAVLEGTCGAFTSQLVCADFEVADVAETFTFTTTAATVYYVYISDYADNGTQTGDFALTVSCTAAPTAPPNDDPCGALPLTINPDYSCGISTAGTLVAATDSGVDSCFGTENNDVWFSFVATGSAHSVNVVNESPNIDMAFAVYDPNPQNCANVAPGNNIWCYDDPEPMFDIVTGLIPGRTYYVQVFSYFGGVSSTTFDICIGSPPPPPANDDPCGAVALTVNPDLACGNIQSGTVLSALNSGVNGCLGTEDDDVWFSFQASSTSHVVQLSNVVGSVVDVNHGIYGPFANPNAPNCNTGNMLPQIVSCSDLNTSITGGLIVGQYYFVQVYTDTAATPQNTTFDICVGTPPTVANDEPCGAFPAVVNPDFLCGAVTSGTVEWATDSPGITSCFGTSDDDVWFSFVATNTAHSFDLQNIAGSTLNLYLGIYGGFPNATGANCVNGTVDAANVQCSDFDSNIFNGFTIGETYFVQVYTWTGTPNQTTTFDLCIGTPPPPPANDDPCGAVALTVGQSCNAVTSSVASALNSGINACFGTPDDDVWFSFVATNSNHTVDISGIFGTTTDLNHAVYGSFTAPDCTVTVGDLVPGSCSDPNSSQLTGLTIGETYFVQVYTDTATPNQTTTFDICVTEPCSNLGPINYTSTVCPLIGAATGSNPFAITTTPGLFDSDPQAYIDCSSANVTLEAYTNIRQTTSYTVEQIEHPAGTVYSPIVASPQVIPNDDIWADAFTTLPFNFCFFGTTYSQLIVSSNGAVSFDTSITPGSGAGWQFDENIPSTDGALTNYSIFSVFQDLNPFGTTNAIQSWVEGTTTGCRSFHISFVDVPLFSDSTRLFTGKTVLYETTNVIEIYILNKEVENGNVSPWNAGNAVAGIQGNAAANEFAVPPCRNTLDDNWATSSEAWRFVPNGAVITPTSYNWYSTLNPASLGTGSTLNVTVPDSYFVEATITQCGQTVTLTDEIVVSQSNKTWTGAVSTDWYEDGNWSPMAKPNRGDCVLIPDTSSGSNRYPVADESSIPIPLPPSTTADALNLTIEAGASLEIMADTELFVTDWIHLDGTINVRSTGSIIQDYDGAVNVNNNTGTGTVNMERTVSGIDSYSYVYWSSPVESFGVSNVSPGSTHIYEWDPYIAANGVGGFGDWLPTTEIMQNGKGYIIRDVLGTPTTLTPVFSGKPNNGIITRAITRGTYNVASPGGDYPGPGGTLATRLDDNWNLVGNPYPSAISATAFILRNATVIDDDSAPVTSGAVYLWRHLSAPSNTEADPFYADFVYNYDPNDYIIYNGSGSSPAGFGGDIAAGQAFFVLMEHTAPQNTSVVRFDNAMRNETLDNSQFYRSESSAASRLINSEKHRIWLDLITPSNSANSILVGYIEGATDEKDKVFDADELSETSTRFYSLVDDIPLSIQGKALPFDVTDTIPLGVEVSQNGNYTIAINTLDGLFSDNNQDIYLEDTYAGITHDLRVSPYSFNIEVGAYDDRFILRYNNSALSIDDFNTSSLKIVAPNNAYINVTSGISTISNVTVYDLHGRILINNSDINTSEFTLETSSYSDGVYIVKAVLTNGKQKLQKVVLNR